MNRRNWILGTLAAVFGAKSIRAEPKLRLKYDIQAQAVWRVSKDVPGPDGELVVARDPRVKIRSLNDPKTPSRTLRYEILVLDDDGAPCVWLEDQRLFVRGDIVVQEKDSARGEETNDHRLHGHERIR